MYFWFKRISEPEDFKEWRAEFERKNRDLFRLLEENLGTRDHEENFKKREKIFLKLEKEIEKRLKKREGTDRLSGLDQLKYSRLRYFLSRACYDAKQFQSLRGKGLNPSSNIRERYNDAKDEIKTDRRKKKKALEELEELAEFAQDVTIEGLNKKKSELDREAEERRAKARLFFGPTMKEGPLNKRWNENQQRLKTAELAAENGLIFELAMLIRYYLDRIPIEQEELERLKKLEESDFDSAVRTLGGLYLTRIQMDADLMEPPSDKQGKAARRLESMNEILALFLKAALGSDIKPEKVKSRLKELKKQGAKFVDWDQCRTEPKPLRPNLTDSEPAYIPPTLFRKK